MWAIMPVMGAPDLTRTAIADILAQTEPMHLLIVNQGCPNEMRREFEELAEQDERVFVWSHEPRLLSLAATWNRALSFVWALGEDRAFVVNNDVRLHRTTVETLNYVMHRSQAYFVSAVGVTQEQFVAAPADLIDADGPRGGPDFSCFVISKAGHWVYPFDEKFIPAYCEDLDTHRRYMLNGDSDKIFSINLPYWHIGSGTLKALDESGRQALEQRIAGSRAYYERKWGGPVNHERYTIPFDKESDQDGVTTPELQATCTTILEPSEPSPSST